MCTPPSTLRSHKSQARPLKATPIKPIRAHHPHCYDRTNHRRAHLEATFIKPTCAHHPQCYNCTNHRRAHLKPPPSNQHVHTTLNVTFAQITGTPVQIGSHTGMPIPSSSFLCTHHVCMLQCLHASKFASIKVCTL